MKEPEFTWGQIYSISTGKKNSFFKKSSFTLCGGGLLSHKSDVSTFNKVNAGLLFCSLECVLLNRLIWLTGVTEKDKVRTILTGGHPRSWFSPAVVHHFHPPSHFSARFASDYVCVKVSQLGFASIQVVKALKDVLRWLVWKKPAHLVWLQTINVL